MIPVFWGRFKMIVVTKDQFLNLLVVFLIFVNAEGGNVNITYVETAVAKGAVCLDGSPPAYHLDRGTDAGTHSWFVHLEGGGWCNNVKSCQARMTTRKGSSKKMSKLLNFTGPLSNQKDLNPDFYTWNRVKVKYCDGASFTGDIEEVDPVTNIHYRGARVFRAVIEDLLAKGMENAENALLSGCSAGGLASILHCDNFKTLLPEGAKVKCLSDAGFFINAKDVSGGQHIEEFYKQVVTLHGSAKSFPSTCTSKMRPDLCFFPQNMAQHIRTPLFILNSAYDSWQISNILVPDAADRGGLWGECKHDFMKCSETQFQTVQDFRMQFLNALKGLGNSSSRGFYINSCKKHCQTERQDAWFGIDSPKLNNASVAEAVGDWYNDRSPFQDIDCPYPCNPTCHVVRPNKDTEN